MLNRAVSTPSWTPNRWTNWRRALSRKETSILFRYLLVVSVLCALGCVYIWQVNTISNISNDTLALESQAESLEAGNVILMQQLALWESPSYIAQRVRELKMVTAPEPLRVKVPLADLPGGAEESLSPQRLVSAETTATTR